MHDILQDTFSDTVEGTEYSPTPWKRPTMTYLHLEEAHGSIRPTSGLDSAPGVFPYGS